MEERKKTNEKKKKKKKKKTSPSRLTKIRLRAIKSFALI